MSQDLRAAVDRKRMARDHGRGFRVAGWLAAGILLAAPVSTRAASAAGPVAGFNAVGNSTGLPAYPNLTDAVMDPVARTDTLGRWCTRFSASTADSLDSVETWYRNILARASETDLTHDRNYANFTALAGVKLAVGIDYVAIYKTDVQAPTRIDLYRCSPVV